jgi:hypothetical protein
VPPGAAEAFEVIVFRPFAGALDVAVAGLAQGAAAGLEAFGGDGKAGPVRGSAVFDGELCAVFDGEGCVSVREPA